MSFKSLEINFGLKEILPRSVVEKVMDLTVPEENLAEALAEAGKLPSVEITKLDLQWLQVILQA